MAEIFNAELTRDDGGPRPVIPAELGAGKTTAAKVWCALHPSRRTRACSSLSD
jgi:hypothetical protein